MLFCYRLLGEIPIRGRVPVSIPGIAKVGDGIQLEQLAKKEVFVPH